MQRQRNELVPVAEVIADLPGPVQALRKTPPPARRGFTLADQVNQLVGASEADPDLGFMARMMALCSLPHTNPGPGAAPYRHLLLRHRARARCRLTADPRGELSLYDTPRGDLVEFECYVYGEPVSWLSQDEIDALVYGG